MNKNQKTQTVVILGASNNTNRYSYQAQKRLLEYGHKVIPVHPKLTVIEDLPVINDLAQINEKVDTLTLYVGEKRSQCLIDAIIALKPRRVIFNPGSESSLLENRLEQEGIPYIHDCTLIMLSTEQFNLASHL